VRRLWGFVIFREKEYEDRERERDDERVCIDYHFNKIETENWQLGEYARSWRDECFRTRQELRACSDCADDVANAAAKRAQGLANELQRSLVDAMIQAQRYPCPKRQVSKKGVV